MSAFVTSTNSLGITTASYAAVRAQATFSDGSFAEYFTVYDPSAGVFSSLTGQLFNPDGSKRGAEFSVAPWSSLSKVTVLENDTVLVTWIGSDTDGLGIKGRIYSSGGAALGPELTLNVEQTGNQNEYSVAALETGGFALAYTMWDTSSFVLAQTYDSSGAPLGIPIQAHDDNFSNQSNPRVVTFSDGRYAVIRYDQAGQGDEGQIIGQDGAIELTLPSNFGNLSVTGLAGDRFIIAAAAYNGTDNDLIATIYDSDGNVFGSGFRLNGLQEGAQILASVTSLQNGGFVVAYQDNADLAVGMYIALFNADGNRVGDDHLLYSAQEVNLGFLPAPTLSQLADGRVLASWSVSHGPKFQILDPRDEAVTIAGTSGGDHYIGTIYDDQISGAGGDDTLDGAFGSDVLIGGLGNDVFLVDDDADDVLEGAGGGFDTVLTSVSYALAASSAVETLGAAATGGVAALNLTGNRYANALEGNAGKNQISGGAGNDSISAGAGVDMLWGGAGNDILVGGIGKDTFVFNTALSARTNVDRISDFRAIDDTIRLENAVFTRLTKTGTLASGAFRVGTKALDKDDRILYNPSTGYLSYDADGNGKGLAVKFATLVTKPIIAAADFFVI